MHLNLSSTTDRPVIISKVATPLRELPLPSEVTFPGVFTWSVVSTSSVTAALGADPGAWNVWRNRRLTPAPLPDAWFRRAPGAPLVYRVDQVLAWLATRRGEPFDTTDAWWECLRTNFGDERADVAPNEVRCQAALYARVAGPVVGDVRFTPAGFLAYLASLLEA